MRMRRIAFCAVCLVGSAAACASFGEAGSTTADGGAEPASDGGAATDGGAASDGGADGRGAPSWCAAHRDAKTIACADFDDRSNGDWASVSDQGGQASWTIGVLPPVDAAPPSPPFVATSLIAEGSTEPNDHARLTEPIPTTVTHTTMSFSINMTRPTLPAATDFVSIGEIFCGGDTDAAADAFDGIFLQLKTAEGTASTPTLNVLIGKSFTSLATAALPFGIWTQVELDVAWSSDDNTTLTTLTIGNVVAASVPNARTSCRGSTSWRAVAGLSSSVKATAGYDDVIFDAY